MLSNIIRSKKITVANKLLKRGFLNNQMAGARGFSSVMGGQEGSTVSQCNSISVKTNKLDKLYSVQICSKFTNSKIGSKQDWRVHGH